MTPKSRGNFVSLSETLRGDELLKAIIRRASRSYLPFDELLNMHLPEQATPLETWNLTRDILKLSAVDETIPDYEGNDYWYYRTHELSELLATITCACRTDSSLHRQLSAAQNRAVLAHARLDETVAAARLDGLDITEQDAYEMLRMGRSPRDATERILLNSFDAQIAVEQFVDEPFTPELIDRLRDLLLVGIGDEKWRTTTSRRGLLRWAYSESEAIKHRAAQTERICAYANGEAGDPYHGPALRALLISDMFPFYRPLPNLNGQVGRLVFRLYALKSGLPVLGSVSLSRSKLLWEDGTLREPNVTLNTARYLSLSDSYGQDLTAYYTTAVQIAQSALNDLRWRVVELERQDAELRTLLQGDTKINHRQRSILGRALKNPDARFLIAHHQRTHNIAYATARADMLDLERRGWLVSALQGKAFVYMPVPNLRELVVQYEGMGTQKS